MSMALALLLAAVLWLIAALHAYWGAGGRWPGADERSLARTVVGSKGIERMPPPAACHGVAVVLLAAGALPLLAVGLAQAPWPSALTFAGLAGCAFVFIARGIIAYIPAFRRFGPEEPFATLDKRLYAPLCLALGAGFLTLLLR
jgi:hypothetical protein